METIEQKIRVNPESKRYSFIKDYVFDKYPSVITPQIRSER